MSVTTFPLMLSPYKGGWRPFAYGLTTLIGGLAIAMATFLLLLSVSFLAAGKISEAQSRIQESSPSLALAWVGTNECVDDDEAIEVDSSCQSFARDVELGEGTSWSSLLAEFNSTTGLKDPPGLRPTTGEDVIFWNSRASQRDIKPPRNAPL